MSENIVIVNKETLEIEAMRTEYSKTYYVTDNQRKLVSSRVPMHVKDKNGKWVDITCQIKGNKATLCPYDGRLIKNKIGYKIQNKKEDQFLEVEVLGVEYKSPEIEDNKAIWKNVTQGIDIVLVFGPVGARFYSVVKNKRARKSFDYRLVVKKEAVDCIGFRGVDSNQKAAHLEQHKKSEKTVKRNGQEFVEIIVTNKLIPEVTEMDEKTRKRYWSKDIKYPVLIS